MMEYESQQPCKHIGLLEIDVMKIDFELFSPNYDNRQV